MYSLTDKIILSLLFLFLVTLIGLVVFDIYGHLTQYETVTFVVTDKQSHTVVTNSCNTINNVRHCTSTKITYYTIYSEDDSFSTSSQLYNQIVTGKKYTFNVSGWNIKNSRRINNILEGN